MKDKDTISKGPKRRDEMCYQVVHDIVIPAGTILRRCYSPNAVGCDVEHGRFFIYQSVADENRDKFKKVVA